MSKIEINNVYKIFGNNPNSVLPMVKDCLLYTSDAADE